MRNEHDDEQHVIDAMLHERLSNESPPDLTDAVMRRFADGEGDAAQRAVLTAEPTSTSPARWLLSAAAVLLGIGAVVGAIWLRDDELGSSAPIAEGEQDPKPQDPKKQKPKPKEKRTRPRLVFDPRNDEQPTLWLPPLGDEAVRMRVVDRHGGPVQSFEVTVLRVFGPNLGRIDNRAKLARRPRDFQDDHTIVDGLHPGGYRLLVRDGMHADSLSEEFTVKAGEVPNIVVKMNMGGMLEGIVVDADGKPVANATITTAQSIETAFRTAFNVKTLSDVATQATVKTDHLGAFTLKRLTPADYRVTIHHPDSCPTRIEAKIAVGKNKPLKVQLERGAIVSGNCRNTSDGAGPMRIRISQQGKLFGDRTVILFETEIGTDDDGNYRFNFRLPPAKYMLQPFVRDPNVGNPFGQLMQMRDSRKRIVVKPGQQEVKQDLVIR